MAITATLSILGLYQFDTTLFSGLDAYLPTAAKLPTGYPDLYYSAAAIDTEALHNMILWDCAELEIAVTDPTILKGLITSWAKTQSNIWQNLYNTLFLKYNPLWNKDGTISETESNNVNKADTARTTQTTSGQNDSNTTETPNSTRTITHKVTGYNTDSFSNESQDSDSMSGTNTSATAGTTQESTTGEGTSSGTESAAREYKRIEQGNIGVTTAQQMIEAERQLVQFDIYKYISDGFRTRFCLLVY